jgi:hypothetical protein
MAGGGSGGLVNLSGVPPTYTFTWPGPNDLAVGVDNTTTPVLIGKNLPVTTAAAQVAIAPVGANITVDLNIKDRATGLVVTPIATVTIPDGSLESTPLTFAAIVIDSNHFISAEIGTIGSVTPGKNMTIQVS